MCILKKKHGKKQTHKQTWESSRLLQNAEAGAKHATEKVDVEGTVRRRLLLSHLKLSQFLQLMRNKQRLQFGNMDTRLPRLKRSKIRN